MDKQKIGNFIKEQRLNKNLTQKYIADKLLTSRENISKWERGLAIPNTEYLKELCDLLDISVAELLAASKDSNEEQINEAIYEMIDSHQHFRKKVIKNFILAIFSLIFIFLIYYFISNYNSIKLYRISGEQDGYVVKDSILLISKDKSYFVFGGLKTNNEEEIKSINLYYLQNENKTIIYKSNEMPNLIVAKNLNKPEIINNLYMDIITKSKTITFKVDKRKDFKNDDLISVDNTEEHNEISTRSQKSKFENFDYDKTKGTYSYSYTKDGKDIRIEYDEFSETIKVLESFENDMEEWAYYGIVNAKIRFLSTDRKECEYNVTKKECIHNNCDEDILEKINYFLTEYAQYLG